MLEGSAAKQRSAIADVENLTIHADFEEVRVFATDRQDVGVELSVSSRMLRRNQPELAVERDGGAVTLRVRGNDLPVSRASVQWGQAVSVPAEIELTVRTTSGAVVVQGLRSGRLAVFTSTGTYSWATAPRAAGGRRVGFAAGGALGRRQTPQLAATSR